MVKAPKTETEQIQFYRQCLDRFEQAAGVTAKVRRYYSIAGTTVCLCFAGESMLPYMTPALEHLRLHETTNPDMTINVWDSISTNTSMPPPPCNWADFTDRGDIWGFNSKRIKTAFHWSEYSVNVMDMLSNTGVYWVKNPKAFPYWVYSSPFRSMIQWWMEKNDCQLLHAAAIGTDHGAVLVSGKGGAGKSTSAVSSLKAGLFYLADDYVIVKKGVEPKVYSLYSTAKLNTEDMPKFPAFQKFAAKTIKKDQEKAVLFLYPELNKQLKREMPLKAILTPVVVGQKKSELRPTSFWPVQRALSFTTMSQLPGAGSHTHKYISELTRQLPCYSLRLGKDLDEIPKVISNLLKHPEKYATQDQEAAAHFEKPLISIIIPVFNGEQFIREAVENILDQNYPAIEIIIVDDGSTDNSKKVIDELPVDVRYFHQPNAGPASARNRGIRDVSGDYVAFLDVDDLWPEKNLELLMTRLQQNPGLDIVRGYAQLVIVEANGQAIYTGNPQESFPDYIGAGLYRKSVFSTVGLFDPELRFGEDSDWFNRAKEMNTNIKRLDEVTLYVRRHDKNMTEGKSLVELNILKVFKKKLERKRMEKPPKTKPALRKPNAGNPLISVVIPVFNGAAFLADAINSVLGQHYHPLEIIVVDDGSTDNTAEVVKMMSGNISYVYQENKGPAAARNKGVKLAGGELISFIDADDIWAKDKLLRQLAVFKKYKEPGIVIGLTFKTKFQAQSELEKPGLLPDKNFHLLLGSTLIKKSVFDKIGLLDEDLLMGEDSDWFNRAREGRIPIAVHQDLVLFYRKHNDNITNNRRKANLYIFKMVKKARDRKMRPGFKPLPPLPEINSMDDLIGCWHSADE
ncbi:MAG: glycosyltransferase [Bacteroidales bacterium]|nr:glycosyltransferase [Bacteroidales bacterium]